MNICWRISFVRGGEVDELVCSLGSVALTLGPSSPSISRDIILVGQAGLVTLGGTSAVSLSSYENSRSTTCLGSLEDPESSSRLKLVSLMVGSRRDFWEGGVVFLTPLVFTRFPLVIASGASSFLIHTLFTFFILMKSRSFLSKFARVLARSPSRSVKPTTLTEASWVISIPYGSSEESQEIIDFIWLRIVNPKFIWNEWWMHHI